MASAFVVAFAVLAVRPIDAAIVVDPLTIGATDVSFGSSIFSPYVPVTNPVADPLESPASDGLLVVGRASSGALRVEGGSQANVRQLWVGLESGANGRIEVAGAGSKLSTFYSIDVGLQGAGTLELSNGGLVEAEQLYVRSQIGGVSGRLLMSGSTTKLDLDYGLLIGGAGTSIVSTSVGAVVEAMYADVGYYSDTGGSAAASVLSNSKWLLREWLDVGITGAGTLTLGDGAEVVAPISRLGSGGGAAALILTGGTLRTDSLYFAVGEISGSGAVLAKGLVADNDLKFDSTQGLQQIVPVAGQPGVSLKLDQQATGVLGAGYVGIGTLLIADGKQVESAAGQLGYAAGSQGTATVTGTGSKWKIHGDLEVGRQGAGVLNIGTGATVDVGGALKMGSGANRVILSGGQLNVDVLAGSPSQLLGQGTIQANGIHMDATFVFDQPGPLNGGITLNQTPSQNINVGFSQPILSVLGAGYRSTGKIEIRNGAEVESAAGALGQEANSHGTAIVEGPGGKWDVEGELRIGSYASPEARGSLKVRNGGEVRASSVRVSGRSGIEVSGPSSLLEVQDLSTNFPAPNGTTLLHVHSGGMAKFQHFYTNGGSSLSRITVDGADSRFRVESQATFGDVLLTVSDGARLEMGSTTSQNPNFRLDGSIVILAGGTIDLGGGGIDGDQGEFLFQNGVLQNFKRFEGNLWQTAGRIEPLQSRTVVQGNYALDSGATLALRISPSLSQEVFRVTDEAVLAGTLEVNLPPQGPLPQFNAGSSFRLIRADHGIFGEFESYSLPQLPIGNFWSLLQTENELRLDVVTGDYNSDGAINAADYTIWRDSLGSQVVAGSGADGDRDGWVTPSDIEHWKNFFGRKILPPTANNAGRAANSLSVPEPTSIFVLSTGLVAVTAACRSRR